MAATSAGDDMPVSMCLGPRGVCLSLGSRRVDLWTCGMVLGGCLCASVMCGRLVLFRFGGWTGLYISTGGPFSDMSSSLMLFQLEDGHATLFNE